MDIQAKAKETFKKFDLNKNGTIELFELKLLLEDLSKDLEISPPDEDEIEAMFKEYDLNKDKKISEEEFFTLFEVFTKMREQ
jgi:Ca2+-binding EF-hand superfamily protein